MSNITPLPQDLIETVAGFTAGVATTFVGHPFDLLKTRLQVNRASALKTDNSFRLVRIITHNEGGPLALYRGLGPNLVGNSVSWALYFLCYERVKIGLAKYHGAEKRLSYYDFFLASGFAGALTAVCTNPIWVIKTRMLATSSAHAGAYSSIFDGARRIYRQEGPLGFYRGLVPSLFGILHGAFQFTAYEQMKKGRRANLAERHHELGNLDCVVFSGLSKIFAGSLTYPYQVVRSRLQTYDANKKYKSSRDVMVKVWQQEGLAGYYKGLGPNLLRVVPTTWVTFLVYENIKIYLPRTFRQEEQ